MGPVFSIFFPRKSADGNVTNELKLQAINFILSHNVAFQLYNETSPYGYLVIEPGEHARYALAHTTILRPHFTFTFIFHAFSGQGLHSEHPTCLIH